MSYSYSRSPTSASGWLTKQSGGGFRKTWHKRWFVLRGNELKYFKTEEDPVPHGIIDLTQYMPVIHDQTCKKSRFAFTLKPRVATADLKSHVIFADSQNEMNHWIHAMHNRIGERSVLDKWLDRLDLNTLNLNEYPRPKNHHSNVLSPTTSPSSDLDYSPRGLRTHRSNISTSSSSSSITTTESSLSSEGIATDEGFYVGNLKDFPKHQQLKDKFTRTISLPPITRPISPASPVLVQSTITSAPSSPTNDAGFPMQSTIASRRNVVLPPLPIKMPDSPLIVCEGDPANGSPGVMFIDTPPVFKARATKRRSNSLPRFDKFRSAPVITTPIFSNEFTF